MNNKENRILIIGTIFFIIVICTISFLMFVFSAKFDKEIYFPLIESNEKLKNEIGEFKEIYRSPFESFDENYHIKMIIKTDTYKYLISLNVKDSNDYEIIGKEENK